LTSLLLLLMVLGGSLLDHHRKLSEFSKERGGRCYFTDPGAEDRRSDFFRAFLSLSLSSSG
jgi:hypothetical protein